MRTYIIAFLMSLLISLWATRFLRDWAIKLKWVDDVGERKIHTTPIPRVGGIAVLIALLCPLMALSLWDNRISNALLTDSTLILSLVGGLSVLAFVGIWDDLKGVPALVKLGAQITAAVTAYSVGVQIEVISIPFMGLVQLGSLSFPLTVFWFVLAINAINLIDGMDGLAGSVVTLAGGTLFVMCLMEDKGVACLILISMLGAVFGFLRYNLNPASIFLGDTGSMALGFMLALVSIHFSQKSSTVFSLVASMLILGVPIFDLCMAVFRRLLSGKRIFAADQYHIHHILLRKGFTQRQSVIVLVGVAVVLEGLALTYIYAGDELDAIVVIAVVLTLAIAVRLLGYNKIIFSQRRHSLLEKVERDGEKSFATVCAFRTRLMDGETDWKEMLSALMKELHWQKIGVCKDGKEYIIATASSFQPSVHVEGVTMVEADVTSELKVQVWMLEDMGAFLPLDKCLVVMVADALTPHLTKDPDFESGLRLRQIR